MKFYNILLGISAILLAAVSAYFSITGLSSLFAGAATAVMVMAGSLEFAKLISSSFVYFYWDRLGTAMKTYMVSGIVVLVIISSLGIYGFLTSAYQQTANAADINRDALSNIDSRIEYFENVEKNTREESSRIGENITRLTAGISDNKIQYETSEGEIITTTSRTQREAILTQLEELRDRRDELHARTGMAVDSVSTLRKERLEIVSSSNMADVGPMQFISDVSGYPMKYVVNAITLAIVLVFDPLAVTLVVAFSIASSIEEEENTEDEPEEEDKKLIISETKGPIADNISRKRTEKKLREKELFDVSEDEPEDIEGSEGLDNDEDTVLGGDDLLGDTAKNKRSKHYPSVT